MAFVDIPVSHGKLEGLTWDVADPVAAAVVCHPHPLFGGTMHNHVTYRIADAFRAAKVATLRFNFRGVGKSTGTYDEGRGEVEDGRAALEYLANSYPGVPLISAGFSFGSRVALRLAIEEPRIERTLAVGLALRLFSFDFARALEKPKAFIHSENDEYATVAQAESLVETMRPPKKLWVLPDADHLCTGKLEQFSAAAKEAVTWLMGQEPTRGG